MSVATRAERRKKPSPDRSVDTRAVQHDGPQIDPEFASLIPALAPDELARLEASLLAEGCRDPLVVWEGHNVLLDGHNRHSLCTRHNIPYNVVSLSFASREAARDFILHTQLGGVPPLLPAAVFTGNVQLPASGNPGNPALDNNGGTPPATGPTQYITRGRQLFARQALFGDEAAGRAHRFDFGSN